MTRVKVCGITDESQVAGIVDAGADAIGLVFYPPSPRAVTVEQARAIRAAVPPYVTVVGLFVDTPVTEINQIARSVGLDSIQFHGDQTPEECQSCERPWYRALRVKADSSVERLVQPWVGKGRGILLDAYVKGVPGGTGTAFNWQQIPDQRDWHLILAGGLDVGNVRNAISQTHPFAVDVSGGVESTPGTKDMALVKAFIQEVSNEQHSKP